MRCTQNSFDYLRCCCYRRHRHNHYHRGRRRRLHVTSIVIVIIVTFVTLIDYIIIVIVIVVVVVRSLVRLGRTIDIYDPNSPSNSLTRRSSVSDTIRPTNGERVYIKGKPETVVIVFTVFF